MRKLTSLALVLIAGLSLTACSGPQAPLGYSTVEKDGRLYVFGFNSGAYQSFMKSGEMGKSKTYVAAGHNGQTVVVEDEVDPRPFLAKK